MMKKVAAFLFVTCLLLATSAIRSEGQYGLTSQEIRNRLEPCLSTYGDGGTREVEAGVISPENCCNLQSALNCFVTAIPEANLQPEFLAASAGELGSWGETCVKMEC